MALWAAAAFVLFNAMITKFHHYIFPAVPPLSLLVGIVLDRALGERPNDASERRSVSAAIGFVALFGIAAMDGIIVLTSYNATIDAGLHRTEAILHSAQSAKTVSNAFWASTA